MSNLLKQTHIVCDKNVIQESSFLSIFAELTENDCINERHTLVKGDNLINRPNCEITENSVRQDRS